MVKIKSLVIFKDEYNKTHNLFYFKNKNKLTSSLKEEVKVLFDNEYLYSTAFCDDYSKDDIGIDYLIAKPLTKIKKQCQTNIPSFGMLGQLNPKQKDVLIQFIWKKIFKQSDINIIMKEYAKIKDKKQITPIEKESIELIDYILEKL